MPIFQERQYQPEADIYALNEKGELSIFELKRGAADGGAVHQALRYAQDASYWNYGQLQEKYQQYSDSETDLRIAHQEAFNLEHSLDAKEINNRQHLVVIGCPADESLISAVDYWRRQGIAISFLPYRIYDIGEEQYFEFFAFPYDKHKNPADAKGLLLDTNRSWDEESIWYMMENRRVAAFGDAKRASLSDSILEISCFFHTEESESWQQQRSEIVRFKLLIARLGIEMSTSLHKFRHGMIAEPCRSEMCLRSRARASFGRGPSKSRIFPRPKRSIWPENWFSTLGRAHKAVRVRRVGRKRLPMESDECLWSVSRHRLKGRCRGRMWSSGDATALPRPWVPIC